MIYCCTSHSRIFYLIEAIPLQAKEPCGIEGVIRAAFYLYLLNVQMLVANGRLQNTL